MPSEPVFLEAEPDSPPYAVVQATRLVGLRSPEDVRWCQLSRLPARPRRLRDVLRSALRALAGLGRAERVVCPCGRELAPLRTFTFTFNTGREASYRLGQCDGCRSVLWDDA
jgi:hypothetical protein